MKIYYQRKDRHLKDYLAELAEKDYERIVTDIGIDPNIVANVYIAPNRKIYRQLQPGKRKTHKWSIGVFYPGENLILLLSPKIQKAGHKDLRQILAHEITHFIMHNITRDKGIMLPVWLHEGLAMYEAREWDWHYRNIMAQISLKKSFIPLSSLEKGFPEEQKQANYAYAQSISLVAYIINQKGRESFHRIIKNLTVGMKIEDAFYDALGLELKELEIQWHRYLRRYYTWIPIITSSFAIWFMITLLALLIYIRKRRLAKEKMALWDLED